ncbi:MAG: MFS transporter, partial [Tepidiformaceae bacterium]
QSVVPRSHLMHAVTTSTLTFQIAAILSPLFFAAVASIYGLTPGFVMVAVTSVFGVVLPFFIRAPGNPAPNLQRRAIPREIVEGFHFVRKHPILPGLVSLDASITVFSYYRETLPAFAAGLYGAGAGGVGLLSSANSIGAAAGTFLVLFMAGFRARGMLVLYASVLYALILFPFGIVPWIGVGVVMIALLGATDAVGMTVRQSTTQLTTPPEMLGRALSFFSVAAYTANNVGTLWVGMLAALIGVPNTMLVGGALSLITVWLTARLVPGIRTYRYP